MRSSAREDAAAGCRRLVAIVGPTAVGKTELALHLAGLVGGEVVSADSRQVYRYLNIGTGKPTPEQRERVCHHLLDVVSPDERFDAADFCRLGRAAIDDIGARGRTPLVCGGSGLYIKALLRGLFPGPKADPGLRQRLLEKSEREGSGALHRSLAVLDSETAARLHPNDVTRVIRALEVVHLTGRGISEWHRRPRGGGWRHPVLVIALWRERERLREMIEARCRAMVSGGLAEEVRSLWARGYGPELQPMRTLGYRHMGTYLAGKRTKEEATAQMVRDTCRYAKRQMTWFRGSQDCRWFNVERESEKALGAARQFVGGG